MDRKVKNDYILLFCEKNSDGTIHLRLKGRELQQRFGGRLEAKHMSYVAEFMRKYPGITSVDFCYNNFGDEGLKFLCDIYFSEPNNLKFLNLMHCDITAVGMKYLSSCNYLCLQKCRLNGNKMGSLGAKFIARLIQQCESLRYIDIAETDQTLESIESILIVVEHSKLNGMNISRVIPSSFYSKYNTTIVADDLSVVLKMNHSLTELVIQKIGFDGHEIDILLSGLKINPNLQLINLGCNSMGDYGAELLAEWLKTRPNLRALDISANSIRSLGARALSFGLPLSKIRYFNISYNHIEDWGLTDLLDSIKKSHQMRILFLWGNKIGITACKRVERMLASGVLQQDYIDVKIYEVDDKLYAAEYPSNHLRQKFYCVEEYACPTELKIMKHKVFPKNSLPRELFNFETFDRYPPVDESLGFMKKKTKTCPESKGKNENTFSSFDI